MRVGVAGGTGVVGRYVVEAVRAAGHDAIVLSRSAGVDTRSGDGLAAALVGAQVVVDTTNADTREERAATEFFVESTTNLGRFGAAAGVEHLVVLSIVGIDRVPTGYYAAKVAHERAALAGRVPATIVRTTQFHEFPAQMIGRTRRKTVAELPSVRLRTVAARSVAAVLLEVAGAPPIGRAPDVCGPTEANLVDLAEKYVRRFRMGVRVVGTAPASPAGSLLPRAGARIEGPSFDEWLASDDAGRLRRAG